MATFKDEIDRLLADAAATLPQRFDIVPFPPTVHEAMPAVHKAYGYVPISCCLMTNMTGQNHCTHPPITYPKPAWHKRARWFVSGKWHRARMRLGSWVAGTDLNQQDNDDY